MNSPHKKLIALIAAIIFSAVACYIPGLQPVPVTPSGNATLTALFHLLETKQPTTTSTVQQAATNIPAQDESPSATPEPVPTQTSVPTSTFTATAMPTPTVSFSGPGMRTGTSIAAVYLTSMIPPTLMAILAIGI